MGKADMRKPAAQSDRSKGRHQRRPDRAPVRNPPAGVEAEGGLWNLSRGLLQRHDEERRRIAAELHDSTAQNLVAACMALSRLEAPGVQLNQEARSLLAELQSHIDRSLQEIRTLCYFLHPPLLDETGLGPALSWYAASFTRASGIRLDLDLSSGLKRLPRHVETALFRIVQESLANVQQHSNSRTARLSIETTPSGVQLTVSDRGDGIPGDTLEKINTGTHTGVGIASMRARAEQLGGRLEIHSSKRGTSIRTVIPLSGGES
jgi:signal transduction histidine kinase